MPRPCSKPARVQRRSRGLCEDCGFQRECGLCTCHFRSLEPTRPMIAPVLVRCLSNGDILQSSSGGAAISFSCSLQDGQGLELRMCRQLEPDRHCWPASVRVSVNDIEVERIDPPDGHTPRIDSPMDLSHHIPLTSESTVRFQACGGAAGVGDFVLCAAIVAPRRSVQDLSAECLSRRFATVTESMALAAAAQQIAPADDDAECISPIGVSLLCPLTLSRLRWPVRGSACQHLQCFDLEPYLQISLATSFQRRWRCPVCQSRLVPAELVCCGLTMELLQRDDSDAAKVEVPVDGATNTASSVRQRVPIDSTTPRKRWKRDAVSQSQPPASDDQSLPVRGSVHAAEAVAKVPGARVFSGLRRSVVASVLD